MDTYQDRSKKRETAPNCEKDITLEENKLTIGMTTNQFFPLTIEVYEL